MPRGGKEVVVTYNGVDGACGGHGVASAGGAGRQRAERVLGFVSKGGLPTACRHAILVVAG
jgi:hypothetical protein